MLKLLFTTILGFLLLSPCQSWAASASGHVFAWEFVPMNYSSPEDPLTMRQNDVRSALEMGLDGLSLEAYNYGHALELMANFTQAADSIGAKNFKVFLVLDMGADANGVQTFTAQNIIDLMTTYGNTPHYMQYNGKPVLSTYNSYSSQLGDAWWKNNVLAPLKKAGHPITFVPYFDRSDPNGVEPSYANWQSLINTYPSVDGLLLFSPAKGVPFYLTDPNGGHQQWSGLETEENEAKALHDSGKIFISPYQPYYWLTCKGERPYYDYQGGRGMGNYWQSVISVQHPEMVDLITWDDYSESTFFQPTTIPITKYPGLQSLPHLGYYELSKYYIAWYKNNKQPTITKDGLFFFYRTHPNNALASDDASVCPLGPTQPGQKWGLVKDSIFVTLALTQATELYVKTGNKEYQGTVPAGLQTIDIPFLPGKQIFELIRNGKVLTKITGADIVKHPIIYNFNIYSGYSIVNGQNSATWMPSDKWKTGYIADWFK